MTLRIILYVEISAIHVPNGSHLYFTSLPVTLQNFLSLTIFILLSYNFFHFWPNFNTISTVPRHVQEI